MRALALSLVFALLACGDSEGTGGSGASGGAGGAGDGGSGVGGGAGGAPQGGSNVGAGPIGGGGSTSTGPMDGCFATFDGVDDVIAASTGAEVAKVNDFSIGAFIDPAGLDAGERMFVAGRHLDGSSNGFYVAVSNESGLEAQFIVFVANSTCTARGPLTLPSSGFIHVLGSYAAPTARVFVNGVEVGSETCLNSPTNIEPSAPMTIGRSQTGVFPFRGDIDEVVYLPGAFTSPFSPASISCASADVLFDFSGVSPGETSTVTDVCAGIAATVGSMTGADAADPTFTCAR